MAAAGGVGSCKVRYIRTMTADTGARRTTDTMTCGSTIDSNSANTVGARTVTEATIRATSHLRIDMTVLTVGVYCTGCVMDICYDIRTAMTAGTLGRPGKICQMPGVSGCSVMTGEVGVVSIMAHQAVAAIADGMERGITGNCSCEFTIRLSAILETAV